MDRLTRERKTIEIMIGIYCSGKHTMKDQLCEECNGLLEYTNLRIDKCPFSETKPTCAKCPVHCYKSDMRDFVRKVMRYSGPKITYKHPILAFQHLIDGFKKPKQDKKSSH